MASEILKEKSRKENNQVARLCWKVYWRKMEYTDVRLTQGLVMAVNNAGKCKCKMKIGTSKLAHKSLVW